ncbi:hypothetical protein VTO42DRAFT_4842 [Malbranchea cinnamomea]
MLPISQPVSYFSPPLAYWQQPRSFRTAKYEPRKRRRKARSDDEESSDDGSGDETELSSDHDDGEGSTPARSSSVLLTPDDAHQYRIAGHSMNSELPGGKFPHGIAPADTGRRKTSAQIEAELSGLNPPVFIPDAKRNHLHLRHLAVLTTILHRCLMEGDYLRAGRAWGLLLRDNFGGHPIDVRTEGRWGIGAEILLWSDQNSLPATDSNEVENPASRNRRWFSRQGFEKAKAYYERLILQYPFRKTAPHALSPLHFYPAMFGLWIATVQEESKTAREADPGTLSDDEPNYSEMEDANSNLSYQDQEELRRARMTLKARSKELAEAQQIATQMDELLVSFPFSDSYELLRLRGMVSLWIADLHVSSVVTDDDNRVSDEYGDISMEETETDLEKSRALERKAVELEKAQAFFEKANARGNRASAPPR